MYRARATPTIDSPEKFTAGFSIFRAFSESARSYRGTENGSGTPLGKIPRFEQQETRMVVVIVARGGGVRQGGREFALLSLPSMLRGEFETVVSMLMSVPRFSVRGRLARPLNYFKYFQMSVGGEGGSTRELELRKRRELAFECLARVVYLGRVRACARMCA